MKRTSLTGRLRQCWLPAALLVVYSGLAIAVSQGVMAWPDSQLADLVQTVRIAPLTEIMVAISSFGDGRSLTAIAIILVVTLLFVRAWWAAALSALAMLLTFLGVLATKGILVRDRPTADLYPGVDAFSFPSGHMANSTVILGIAGLLLAFSLSGPARRGVVAAGIVFLGLMGFTRIYLGAHWPSDVLASTALGAAVLLCIGPVLRSIDWSDTKRRSLFIGLAVACAVGIGHVLTTFETARARYGVERSIPAAHLTPAIGRSGTRGHYDSNIQGRV